MIESSLQGVIHVVDPDFRLEFLRTLRNEGAEFEELLPGAFLVSSGRHWFPFVRNHWLNPKRLEFNSINEAAKRLRVERVQWAHWKGCLVRRGELILQAVKKRSTKRRLAFPPSPSDLKAKWGTFSLLSQNHLIFASQCSSVFPNGEVRFEENRTGPPNRAYLKLWEALCYLGSLPKRGERCLDLGASPGGWTWVLSQFGTSVVAVDRSPLHPTLVSDRIQFQKGDALSVSRPFEDFDWIVSDIVSRPESLYPLLQSVLEKSPRSKIVATLKFKKGDDYSIVREFLKLAPSKLVYLPSNKHEVTWIYVPVEGSDEGS